MRRAIGNEWRSAETREGPSTPLPVLSSKPLHQPPTQRVAPVKRTRENVEMLLEVSRSDVQRMESFRSSSDYSSAASSAYSPYWRHHSARISTSVMHDSAATAKVEVAGDSGFYIPPPSDRDRVSRRSRDWRVGQSRLCALPTRSSSIKVPGVLCGLPLIGPIRKPYRRYPA